MTKGVWFSVNGGPEVRSGEDRHGYFDPAQKTIVIGKNSSGQKFSPVAIILDTAVNKIRIQTVDPHHGGPNVRDLSETEAIDLITKILELVT